MTIYVDNQRIYEVEWKGDKNYLRSKLMDWCRENKVYYGGVKLWCGEWVYIPRLAS